VQIRVFDFAQRAQHILFGNLSHIINLKQRSNGTLYPSRASITRLRQRVTHKKT